MSKVVNIRSGIQTQAVVAASRTYEALNSLSSRAPNTRPSDSVSISIPAPYGSYGDEGMILGAQEAFRRQGIDALALTKDDIQSWLKIGCTKAVCERPWVQPGGLSIRSSGIKNLVPGNALLVLGADSVDGAYGLRSLSLKVSLLNGAVRGGKRAALANFSMRETVPRAAIRVLRTLSNDVSLFARDEVSQVRAESVFGREVGIYPDIAMLMPATRDESSEKLASWIDESPDPVIGLVVNAHLRSLYSGSLEPEEAFTAATQSLIRAGYRVALIAHDVRRQPGDIQLLATIVGNLGNERDRVRSYVPASASGAKAALGLCRIVVTARMHGAVAALSQGVPTVGLEYVGKFVGQFRWYQAEDLVQDWRVAASRSDFLELIEMAASEGRGEKIGERAEKLVNGLPSWI